MIKYYFIGDNTYAEALLKKLCEYGKIDMEQCNPIGIEPVESDCIYYLDENNELSEEGIDTVIGHLIIKNFIEITPFDVIDKYNFTPFEQVLVRDDDCGYWACDLFSNMTGDNKYICVGSCWKQCIPYNDYTKKFLGTRDEFIWNKFN